MIAPKEIIRSNRKTIALVVNNKAELIVRAPYTVCNDYINHLIESKETWIKLKQESIRINNEIHIEKSYKDGESFLYLGNNYILDFVKTDAICLLHNRLLVPVRYEGNAKEPIIDWFKQQAYMELNSRLDFYAKQIGAKYNGFRLSDAKGRWGSCGSKQTINLNWRMVMCPQFAIDYVAIHELSHLQFKNHSKEFWNRVYTIMPNYKEAETWLNENVSILKF